MSRSSGVFRGLQLLPSVQLAAKHSGAMCKGPGPHAPTVNSRPVNSSSFAHSALHFNSLPVAPVFVQDRNHVFFQILNPNLITLVQHEGSEAAVPARQPRGM